MEQREKKSTLRYFEKFPSFLPGIFIASIAVTIIAYGGYLVIDLVPWKWLWIFPLIAGATIYFSGYLIVEKLKRIEEVKNEFLTVAAHNLRTPLTKIQWLINDVAGKVHDTEASRRFTNMQDTFKDLTKIVNRFLEISEAGQTSIYFSYLLEKQNLEYVILQAIAENKIGIDQKNIAVTTRIQEGLPDVYVDKERIQLVANILIENAILYNKQNGTIDIDIYENKNSVVCSLKNTGIGITRDDIPKIFTKFFRSREAVSVDTDRVGLELSLAKEIIAKHHGKIHVESEGKGKGARFWFELPAQREKE